MAARPRSVKRGHGGTSEALVSPTDVAELVQAEQIGATDLPAGENAIVWQ
jgi:hypothetical protein